MSFFLTVGQNKFGNKIPFLNWIRIHSIIYQIYFLWLLHSEKNNIQNDYLNEFLSFINVLKNTAREKITISINLGISKFYICLKKQCMTY